MKGGIFDRVLVAVVSMGIKKDKCHIEMIERVALRKSPHFKRGTYAKIFAIYFAKVGNLFLICNRLR